VIGLRGLLTAVVSVVAVGVAPSPSGAQSQTDLNQQAGAALREADRRLNASYAKLRAKLSPESRAKLQAAEEAWIRYRDQECAFVGSATAGGSIHSMIVAQCLTVLTDRRTRDIETQLDCREGDLSCIRN
jgi:uncharacterized protein YecT (DUF1311 family)